MSRMSSRQSSSWAGNSALRRKELVEVLVVAGIAGIGLAVLAVEGVGVDLADLPLAILSCRNALIEAWRAV